MELVFERVTLAVIRSKGVGIGATSGMAHGASLSAVAAATLGAEPHTHYKVECFKADGTLRWVEDFDNIVVTVGKNKLLDATFKTGLTSPTWYIGLKDSGTVSATDTMASHSGWTEDTTFSNSTRPAYTPGAIAGGSVSNSSSVAIFNINGSTTIYGCFLVDNNTVGGSTGTLYGAGDFSTNRPVISGDTLNVTVTLTIS